MALFDINTDLRESALTQLKYRRDVHNLRHTFGLRLRAAEVSFEDRQYLGQNVEVIAVPAKCLL